MKRNLLFLTVAYLCHGTSATAQQYWNPILEFQKNNLIGVTGTTLPFTKCIDSLNSTKTPAFYGNFNKSYSISASGARTFVSDSGTSLVNGHSAGYIKFDPNFGSSTILSHCKDNGTEYIGVFKADSNNVAASTIMYLKGTEFVPETSIQLSGASYVFPLGNSKFYITGNFYTGWDKSGPKTLSSSCIWDKTTQLLNRKEGLDNFPKQIAVSNKDGTIVIVSIAGKMNVLWYGDNNQWKSDLYPSIPTGGNFTSVYSIDRQKMYAVWQSTDGSVSKVLQLDFTAKVWNTVATANGTIASISGDDGDNVFFSGSYTTLNGSATGHVNQYSIAKNTLTALPALNLSQWDQAKLSYTTGALYLIDDGNLVSLKEIVYQLSTKSTPPPPPPPVIIPLAISSFSGQTIGVSNTLTWKTDKEQHASFFQVERGADSTTFLSLGKVTAIGNSSIQTTYSFTDLTPINGNNFYRIKIVDSSAKFIYSFVVKLMNKKDTVPIDPTDSTIIPPVTPGFTVYPNPVRTTITVVVPDDENGQLQIIGMNGFVTKTSSAHDEVHKKRLDVSTLPPGTYILKYTTKSTMRSTKFIKL